MIPVLQWKRRDWGESRRLGTADVCSVSVAEMCSQITYVLWNLKFLEIITASSLCFIPSWLEIITEISITAYVQCDLTANVRPVRFKVFSLVRMWQFSTSFLLWILVNLAFSRIVNICFILCFYRGLCGFTEYMRFKKISFKIFYWGANWSQVASCCATESAVV